MSDQILLADAASMLKVHPRTILRGVSDSGNPTYTPGDEHSKYVSAESVRQAYAVPSRVWSRVIHGSDELLTRHEICEEFNINGNLFKKRRYPCHARRGKVLRYSRKNWIEHHLFYYGG